MPKHIRDVGAHAHQWQTAASLGAVKFQFCNVCGTRRAMGSVFGQPTGQDIWLRGGDWVGDKPKDFVEPEMVDLGSDEAASRQVQQARAMGSVGRPKAVPEEIIKAQGGKGTRPGEATGGVASALSDDAEEQAQERMKAEKEKGKESARGAQPAQGGETRAR